MSIFLPLILRFDFTTTGQTLLIVWFRTYIYPLHYHYFSTGCRQDSDILVIDFLMQFTLYTDICKRRFHVEWCVWSKIRRSSLIVCVFPPTLVFQVWPHIITENCVVTNQRYDISLRCARCLEHCVSEKSTFISEYHWYFEQFAVLSDGGSHVPYVDKTWHVGLSIFVT
jgi:hypothetical protein